MVDRMYDSLHFHGKAIILSRWKRTINRYFISNLLPLRYTYSKVLLYFRKKIGLDFLNYQ